MKRIIRNCKIFFYWNLINHHLTNPTHKRTTTVFIGKEAVKWYYRFKVKGLKLQVWNCSRLQHHEYIYWDLLCGHARDRMCKRIILSQGKGQIKNYQKVVEFLKEPVCAELPVEWMKKVIKNSLPTTVLIPRDLKTYVKVFCCHWTDPWRGNQMLNFEKGIGCSHSSAMLPAGPVTASLLVQ